MGITAGETAVGFGAAKFVGYAATGAKALGFSAAVVGGAKIVAVAAVGYGIAKGFNLLRDRWLGYLYIFEIYAVINSKKKLYYLDLKEAV